MRERAALEYENKALAPSKDSKAPAKATAKPVTLLLPPKCAQPSPWPDAECERSRPSADRLRRRAMALANVILEGVQNTKEHGPGLTGGGPFAGSWDWHSAVHGHWALLSIARVHGFTDLDTWLTKRLTDKAIADEFMFLTRNRKQGFEVPYGRAWFLMVLLEFARRRRRSTQLEAITRGIQEDVLGYLERSALPEGKNGFLATHDSWLFAYLLVALSDPSAKPVLDRMRALRKNKFEPARSKIIAFTPAKSDFMDLAAVLALIDRVDPTFSGTPAAITIGPSPALDDPPLTSANEHSAGTALVQVWPHAFEAHRGDKASCSRFHGRMNEMFSRTDHWADSFKHVAHWVPQFMWMGMWLAAGRP